MKDKMQDLAESAPISIRTQRSSVVEHHEWVVEPVHDVTGLWARFAPAETGGPVLVLDLASVRAVIAACEKLPWITDEFRPRRGARQS